MVTKTTRSWWRSGQDKRSGKIVRPQACWPRRKSHLPPPCLPRHWRTCSISMPRREDWSVIRVYPTYYTFINCSLVIWHAGRRVSSDLLCVQLLCRLPDVSRLETAAASLVRRQVTRGPVGSSPPISVARMKVARLSLFHRSARSAAVGGFGFNLQLTFVYCWG
jgi:hypothetical protein